MRSARIRRELCFERFPLRHQLVDARTERAFLGLERRHGLARGALEEAGLAEARADLGFAGLGDGNGLELVGPLRQARPDIRIVVLTGYGNIATAVAAVKEGAVDYLAKPADADAIEQALTAHGRKLPPPPSNPMSADRVRWEHIQRVFEQCDRNVSETARRLNMHRRTLQRILGKHAPREH